jgi:cyclase
MLNGYDLQLLEEISNKINVPLIASGGAGSLADLKEGLNKGCADAVAAGSLFVFHGKRQAVLISYPDENEMKSIYN